MTPLISGLASVASLLINASSSSSARRTAAADADASASSSSKVLLGADAEALARLSGKGISTAMRTVQSAAGETHSVSKADFRRLLAEFGASEEQQARLADGFDANQDGSISRDEFLQRMAGTTGPTADSGFSQALLQLIDRHGNANGVVNQNEFVQFTTAFVQAQSRRAA